MNDTLLEKLKKISLDLKKAVVEEVEEGELHGFGLAQELEVACIETVKRLLRS